MKPPRGLRGAMMVSFLINPGVGPEPGGTVHFNFDAAGLRCSLYVPRDGQDRFTWFRQDNGSPLPAA